MSKYQYRRKNINHDYFDHIDTEYKAYILGFIYADGCIVKGTNGRQASLRVGIAYSDGYILQPLLDDIYGIGNKQPTKKHAPAMIRANEQAQAIISISSDQLVNSLERLGCYPQKTVVGLDFPDISKNLIHHFIRGFFDGDGCITVGEVKNRYTRVATYTISNTFKSKLRKRIIFTSTDHDFLQNIYWAVPFEFKGTVSLKGKIRKLKIWKLSIEHQEDVQQFFKYMYNGATVFLKRKYNKFTMTIKSQAEGKLSEGVETT